MKTQRKLEETEMENNRRKTQDIACTINFINTTLPSDDGNCVIPQGPWLSMDKAPAF